MEKSFDFGALLQNHKKHKRRPMQFVSVAGGVRKRLESNIKSRKSSRLTNFDSIRNLPKCESAKKHLDPLTKEEHRRMQLEKWKEEKEKKKKEAAAQKKKPFIAGVAHAPLKFVPPPPLPKAVPSTSGRVTRSQSAKVNSTKLKTSKTTTQQVKIESFAPKNAAFKAPEIKSLAKVPTLAAVSKSKKVKETIMFDPVFPGALKIKSKVKSKPEPKLTEIKKNIDNLADLVDKRPSRGKLVKSSSSSSQSQHSSSDKVSPISKNLKSKAKTPTKPPPVSLEENISPVPDPPKPRRKTSRKSIHNSLDTTSSVIKRTPQKTKTPKIPVISNKTSTPRNPIPKSESSSEEKLRSPKSPADVPLTPEQIVEEAQKNSPFVTLSRGKENARRETKKKICEGLFEEDASNVDSVDHFRRQLNSEIKRMTEMCETWEKISEQIVLPESVQEAVLGAVGQARLLMSHKLQQFAALVARCERPEPGHALVTPADLHGFWDMVFMQVVNVDVRFKKLEEMRARNWVEEAPVAPRRKPAPKVKPPPKPAAASRLRDVIAAARKAKNQDVQIREGQHVGPEPPAEAAKTFEAGFFCVRSPVRSPAPPAPPAAHVTPHATPARAARPSLLKAVLSSEAKKSATKNATSLAMLRASLIGKNVENDTLAEPLVPLTPINLHATPGRSILKPTNMPSAKKSIKVVLFDDSDAESSDSTQKNGDDAVSGVRKLDYANNDSGSTGDVDKEQKENETRRKPLVRQDALAETSPVMTRSRRKSMSTPALSAAENIEEKMPKRTSRRKKALQEVEVNIMEKNYTPKRSSRRKSNLQADVA